MLRPIVLLVLGLVGSSAQALPPYANCGAWIGNFVADPFDDTGRLAFADDSTERDDPLNAYLRGDVELAVLENDPTTRYSERVYELRAATRRMLLHQQWGDLANTPAGTRIFYRRGFPETIKGPPWLHEPLIRVLLDGPAATATRLVVPDPLRRFSADLLARFRDLELTELHERGIEATLVTLRDFPPDRRLRSLSLEAHRRAVAESTAAIVVIDEPNHLAASAGPVLGAHGHGTLGGPRATVLDRPYSVRRLGGSELFPRPASVFSPSRFPSPTNTSRTPPADIAALRDLQEVRFAGFFPSQIRTTLPHFARLSRLKSFRVPSTPGGDLLLTSPLLSEGSFPALETFEIPGAGDTAFAAFARSSLAGRLRELRLGSQWPVAWEALRALTADFTRFPRLHTLGVHVMSETDVVPAVRALVALPTVAGYRALHVSVERDDFPSQPTSRDGALPLALANLAAEELSFTFGSAANSSRSHAFTLGDWIARGLRQQGTPPHLRSLSLRHTELSGDGLSDLASATFAGPLYELDLRNNRHARASEMHALFQASWFSSVRILGLSLPPHDTPRELDQYVRELPLPASVQELLVDQHGVTHRWIRDADGTWLVVPVDAHF